MWRTKPRNAVAPIARKKFGLVRSVERTRSLLGAEVEAVVLSAGKHALREAWNGNQLVAFATKKGNQHPADEAGGASDEYAHQESFSNTLQAISSGTQERALGKVQHQIAAGRLGIAQQSTAHTSGRGPNAPNASRG